MYLHSLIAQRGLTVNVPVGGGAVLKKTKKKTLWMPGVGDMTNIISVLTDISVICNMYHDIQLRITIITSMLIYAAIQSTNHVAAHCV